ncbi:hypothetical protein RNM09_005217, partial [Escherichia coli]|nr:hypothetical protein [Escherichia coli]ELF7083052.1 hypothetical protein [Escherichia coli]
MNHEEMNQRFSRLENEIAELNKKLSTLMPSEDEKNAAMSRNLSECFSIHNDNFSELE